MLRLLNALVDAITNGEPVSTEQSAGGSEWTETLS
jgi:hypothetical protein